MQNVGVLLVFEILDNNLFLPLIDYYKVLLLILVFEFFILNGVFIFVGNYIV